ncbi:hypothetical protein B296_00028826 [Ensete ventricosum]|uniref:Uncharacterized protein n=1 Tax=Ensete ventricosum TaxID=4639 RepID=A0A426YAA9_ENSVE|nr:hypothetical protein B296_00028826 [Ensete ventricosum]
MKASRVIWPGRSGPDVAGGFGKSTAGRETRIHRSKAPGFEHPVCGAPLRGTFMPPESTRDTGFIAFARIRKRPRASVPVHVAEEEGGEGEDEEKRRRIRRRRGGGLGFEGFRGGTFRVSIPLDDWKEEMLSGGSMRKSFKDSLKVLEADIQHANTLYFIHLQDLPYRAVRAGPLADRYAGRLLPGGTAKIDCQQSISAVGGRFWPVLAERGRNLVPPRATLPWVPYAIRRLWGIPSPRAGRTSPTQGKGTRLLMDYTKMNSVPDTISYRDELGICRNSRSQSCPFCRDSLKRVDSGDLWVYVDHRDVVDMAVLTRDNIRRLIMYIKKLPVVVPESVIDAYDSHVR